MCCAFGVMVLLFLVIKHNPLTMATAKASTPDLSSEVKMLDKEILEGQQNLAELKNTVAEVDQQDVTAEGLARRISEQITQTEGNAETREADRASEEIAALRQQVEDLEKKKDKIASEEKTTGEDARAFAGEGSRQYITGLRLDGQRILVLLDVSASMLDKTIVNVIRRKNMADDRKRNSEKWQQAVRTVDWLSARFPPASHYQIYTFNTDVHAALPETQGQWLNVSDLAQLNKAVDAVGNIIPYGGTSLEKAIMAARQLQPLPDDIVLITDGLPTQGRKPPLLGTKVSGRERQKLFNDAAELLPRSTPVNVILLPMEGDPAAAFSYWGLAIASRGSFMSPAQDWP